MLNRRVAVPSEAPALVIADGDGVVVRQNQTARRLMGGAEGRACWEVVGGLEGATGLPCAPGCARELVENERGTPRHSRVQLLDRPLHLTCVPLHDGVACLLSSGMPAAASSRPLLTPREVEVLRLLADGETTPAIAARLGRSGATVRTHVEHMRAKLGVKTRGGLVALGFRLGLLS